MYSFNPDTFHWAVGIENTFIPHERPGLRALEEYELTQHYHFWREDIDRAADLGVGYIRWGIPWYRVNPERGRYHWAWVDEVLDYLVNQKGIQPIVDLVHYGTPLWLENSFIDPDYPQYVAEYAHAVAERYGSLVRYYTPLNEPTLNAEYGGRREEWPPYLAGEEGYVQVLLPIVRGMVCTTRAVREADPDAVFVQVEAMAWGWTQDKRLEDVVENRIAHTYLANDLYMGRVDTHHLLWPYLRQHGVTENDLAWLQENKETVDIFGVNFYPWSGGEAVLDTDGRPRLIGKLNGQHLADVMRRTWERYQIPLMITETSAKEDVTGRARWMDETITAVAASRAEGVPILGYTWFPMMTMVDWEYRRTDKPVADYLIHLGLWDATFDENQVLQRMSTPLVEKYRHYVSQGTPQPIATT